MILGYERADGRKGIRNYVLVAYLVECAHHVARAIATPFGEGGAQLIGFPGCYPNSYAQRMMEAFCTHPNVGAVEMKSRKPVLLRIQPGLYEELRMWAKEEVRSVNAQIEYLLQQAVLRRERPGSRDTGPHGSLGSRRRRGL